jgi:hypothetical protein
MFFHKPFTNCKNRKDLKGYGKRTKFSKSLCLQESSLWLSILYVEFATFTKGMDFTLLDFDQTQINSNSDEVPPNK